MNSPILRLVLRAILAAVTTFATALQQSTNWDRSLISGAIVGAVLAAAEVLTPLNATVGPTKPAAGPVNPVGPQPPAA